MAHPIYNAFYGALAEMVDGYYERGELLEACGWTTFIPYMRRYDDPCVQQLHLDPGVLEEAERYAWERTKRHYLAISQTCILAWRSGKTGRQPSKSDYNGPALGQIIRQHGEQFTQDWVSRQCAKAIDQIVELTFSDDGRAPDEADWYCPSGFDVEWIDADQKHYAQQIAWCILTCVQVIRKQLEANALKNSPDGQAPKPAAADGDGCDGRSARLRKNLEEFFAGKKNDTAKYIKSLFEWQAAERTIHSQLRNRTWRSMAAQQAVELERHRPELWQQFDGAKNAEVKLVEAFFARELAPLGFRPAAKKNRHAVLYAKPFHDWVWHIVVHKLFLSKPEGTGDTYARLMHGIRPGSDENVRRGELFLRFALGPAGEPVDDFPDWDEMLILELEKLFPVKRNYKHFYSLRELELFLMCHLQMYKLVQGPVEAMLEKITAEHPAGLPQTETPTSN